MALLVNVNGGVQALTVAELDELEKLEIGLKLLSTNCNFDPRVDRIEPSLGDLCRNRDREGILVESSRPGVELAALVFAGPAGKHVSLVRNGGRGGELGAANVADDRRQRFGHEEVPRGADLGHAGCPHLHR